MIKSDCNKEKSDRDRNKTEMWEAVPTEMRKELYWLT